MSSIPHKINNIIKSSGNTSRLLLVAEKDSRTIYWILGMISLCALTLRMLVINRPIGYDEAYTFIYFASRPFKYILLDYHVPNNHILNTILIGVAYRILGDYTWIVRLPALIASVLCVPAAYFTARRFFTPNQALGASAILAVYPAIILFTANGRGYMLVMLLSLILANIAGLLVTQQNRTALIAYAIIGALGFYTIPIFLYPMAGISLWVAATHLINHESRPAKLRTLTAFLGACILSGLMTLMLYSPVIIFGTGFDSIFNNEIVTPRTWLYFTESLVPRITRTWAEWIIDLNLTSQYLLSGGFLVALFFYRKASNQKLPLQLFLFLAIAILLVLQKVAPLPRVWIYLELFCLIFAAAGLVWSIDVPTKKFAGEIFSTRVLPFLILFFTITVSINSIMKSQSPSAVADRTQLPEQYAADYLASHLKPGDTILALAPIDMRTAYHLKINGVPYDVFYQRDHPTEFQNALVIVREREKLNTPEKVVEFFQLLPKLDPASAELVFTYGELHIYSIRVRQ